MLTSRLWIWCASITLVFFVAVVATIYGVRSALQIPEATLPTFREMCRGVTIYDKNNKVVCTIYASGDRRPVPIYKISPNIINGFLATEDRNFYHHSGVDFSGIARAYMANQQAGRIVQGGSTITQQLVKHFWLDPNERTYKRKLKEAFLAWDVERRYSKKKILETYLNTVYFGGGVNGVDRAAQHYFNKTASNVTVAEGAFLAGLVKSPTVLGDPKNRAKALERQQVVVEKELEYGLITPAQAKEAQSTKLAFHSGPRVRPFPHYIGYVEETLKRELGDKMWVNSWKVYTHLDPKAQQLAEKTLNDGISHAPKGIDQGALVSMSTKDGGIVAMVGGVGPYEKIQWNRATHPHTAGSAFKPFVYLSGLIQGVIQADTLINDAPLVIEREAGPKYEPKNFDGRFRGWMTARSALAWSCNVCAVRVAQQAGLGSVIELAHAAGIRAQLDAYPALALGCCAVSPLDMTTAYATLARGGVHMTPQVLRHIDTENGMQYRVYNATPSANLPAEQVAQLVDVMQDVVRCGTGHLANLRGVQVAGKTGTADDAKDLWFVGFTPDTVTTVWGGNDLNKKVRGHKVTGGTVMAGIWHRYMTGYLTWNKPSDLAFTKPATPLIRAIPHWDDETLLTYSYGDSAVLHAGQINNIEELEQIDKVGIARAFEVQKVAAVKRQRANYDALVAQYGSEDAARLALQQQQQTVAANGGDPYNSAVASTYSSGTSQNAYGSNYSTTQANYSTSQAGYSSAQASTTQANYSTTRGNYDPNYGSRYYSTQTRYTSNSPSTAPTEEHGRQVAAVVKAADDDTEGGYTVLPY